MILFSVSILFLSLFLTLLMKKKIKVAIIVYTLVFILLFIINGVKWQIGKIGFINNTNYVLSVSDNTIKDGYDNLIDGFENASRWSVDGGEIVLDAVNYKYGNSGIKITSSNLGGTVSIRKSITLSCSDMDVLSFWLYVPDKSNLADGSINILLTSNNFKSYFISTKTKYYLNNGWNYLKLNKNDFTNINDADWNTAMTTIMISLYSKNGQKACATIDELRKNEKTEPKVLIMMDDGYASVYDKMYPYYKNRNIPVTVGVIKDAVGTDNYMTESQLKKEYNDGWAMANHTTTHSIFTTLNDTQIANEITTCTSYLNSLGFTKASDCLVFPTGEAGDNVHIRSILKSCGIKLARGSNSGIQYTPLDEPLSLKNTLELKNATTLEDVKAAIDKAIAIGGIAIIIGHKVGDTPNDEYEVNTSVVKGMADYIVEKGIKAITIDNLK